MWVSEWVPTCPNLDARKYTKRSDGFAGAGVGDAAGYEMSSYITSPSIRRACWFVSRIAFGRRRGQQFHLRPYNFRPPLHRQQLFQTSEPKIKYIKCRRKNRILESSVFFIEWCPSGMCKDSRPKWFQDKTRRRTRKEDGSISGLGTAGPRGRYGFLQVSCD